MDYGQFTSPFGTIDLRLLDFSDFEFPSDEAILEAILQFLYRGRTYTVVCVFFPFGRLPKLIIEETLGLSLTTGST